MMVDGFSTRLRQLPIAARIAGAAVGAHVLGTIAVTSLLAPAIPLAVGLVLLLVPSIAVWLAVTFLVRALVEKPLGGLAADARRIAGGGLDSPVESEGLGREFQAAARSIEACRLTFREMTAVTAEAGENCGEQTDLPRREAARASAVKLQGAILGLLGIALQRLAAGDMSTRISIDLPGRYQPLKADFNRVVEKFGAASFRAAAFGRQVGDSVGAIDSCATQLRELAGKQTMRLDDTVEAARGLSRHAVQAAASAGKANDELGLIGTVAQTGSEIVQGTAATMTEIGKASAATAAIAGVIEETATQINLMAINASIEAARAGDGARGVATITDEVRALAQRAASSAEEMRRLVAVSEKQLRKGSKRVDATGAALAKINERIERIRRRMATLSETGGEQVEGLERTRERLERFKASFRREQAIAAGLSSWVDAMESSIGEFNGSLPANGAKPLADRTAPSIQPFDMPDMAGFDEDEVKETRTAAIVRMPGVTRFEDHLRRLAG